MMTKKSQSALEYLMTYGWAILIIVIVGAALFALGVFNPSSSSTMTMNSISDFQLVDASITSLGNLTLILGTKTGKTTTVTSISYTVAGTTCSGTSGSQIITPSQAATININATTACSLSSGSQVDLIPFTVSYTVAGSSLAHSQSGSILKLSVQ